MGHLPVRDVHLLVVARRERKHRYVSTSKNPVNVCLHRLQIRKSSEGENDMRITNVIKMFSPQASGSVKNLVHNDEALGVHVNAALL